MTDLVTAMLARKHQLLDERDKLDYQITSLCTAIDALQLPETTPEAPHLEVQQPEGPRGAGQRDESPVGTDGRGVAAAGEAAQRSQADGVADDCRVVRGALQRAGEG